MSRFDSTIDMAGVKILEFPTFSGSVVNGVAHVFIGSLASADIGTHVAFASKSGAGRLVLYMPPALNSETQSYPAAEVSSVLSLQGQGFNIEIEVLSVEANALRPVAASSNLEVLIQDESAMAEFLELEGASEIVELALGCGCEVLFLRNRMIVTHLGLEVARSKDVGGRLELEVGVGRNDRMAKALLSESPEPEEKLAETLDVVNRYRLGFSRFHPLARLSLSRWMRLVIQDDPAIIGMDKLTPVELVREGGWPTGGLWSLKRLSGPEDGEAPMYRGYDSSFEEDGFSFALASDGAGIEYVVGISSAVDLGAAAKLYEVIRAAESSGRKIGGSILVLEERNKIPSIDRMTSLASFRIRSVSLLPAWKTIVHG